MDTQQLLPVITHKVSHNPQMMRSTIRSPLKMHGGKFYLSSYHLSVCHDAMKSADAIIEPCCGGANFTLQSPSFLGVPFVLADCNPLFWNVWDCFCSDKRARLVQAIADSLEVIVCKESALAAFNFAKVITTEAEKISDWTALDDEQRTGLAYLMIVRQRFSRGGMGNDFGWQDRLRGGIPGELNSWKNFATDHVHRVASKCLNAVAFLCSEFTDFLASKNHFVYFDPPYLKTTRTAPNVYRYEWTNEQHESFISQCLASPAKIAICAYESEMYNRMLSGWQLHKFAIVNHSGQGAKKQDRIECLYCNF